MLIRSIIYETLVLVREDEYHSSLCSMISRRVELGHYRVVSSMGLSAMQVKWKRKYVGIVAKF